LTALLNHRRWPSAHGAAEGHRGRHRSPPPPDLPCPADPTRQVGGGL